MRKCGFKFYKLIFAVLLLWGLSLTTLASGFSQLEIKNMVVDEALKQGVEPSLALAIAKVESDFNPAALSYAGAKGVMQIMPATAQNGFKVASHDLYKAEVNIRVGVAFIKQLLKQYQGDVDIALSHYNGGSAVKRSNGTLRIIPATSNYVRKVRHYAQHYRNEGYDAANLFQQHQIFEPRHERVMPQNAIYARTTIKPPRHLSYAQQMALDEQDHSKRSAVSQPAEVLNIVANEPRIDQLQQLRVHNLTRVLGPKTAKPEPDPGYEQNEQPEPSNEKDVHNKANSTNLTARNEEEWQLSAANMRSYREVYAETPPPQLSSKQQKVANWEAIFD